MPAPVPFGPTPVLRPGSKILWRDDTSVQLEQGARRIVVDNVTSALIADLCSRPDQFAETDDRFRPVRSDPDELNQLRLELAELGFLTPGGPALPLPAHLAPELGSVLRDVVPLSEEVDPAAVFAARRAATIAVYGTSRIAATVAATLAAAGVGHIQLIDAGRVRAADACPGGLAPSDEGQPFMPAATAAVKRATPDVLISRIGPDACADLALLTDPAPVDPSVRDDLHLRSVAHLRLFVDGSKAVIGPLVIPGVTSCLRCADLHRTDRDPAWPLLAVQLANRPRHRESSDVTLTMAASGLGAGQALAFLDGTVYYGSAAYCGSAAQDYGMPQHNVAGATVEWEFPDWRLRRRTWPPHLDCDCGAAPDSPLRRQNG